MHMMDRLVNMHGWTPAAAAIAAGNVMQESGFNPSNAGDPSIPGGSRGYAQWNRDRLANLRNFADQRGTAWTDPDTQIDFLAQEAKNRVPDWSSQADLSNARSISKAYEGYGVEGARVPDAAKFYDMYQNRPQPQSAQAAPAPQPPPQAAPSAQPQNATGGQQAQADPMSNIYNRIAFAPDVQAGYDSPRVMFDPDQSQAKRGGSMRRRHFDDGGDAGGDGGGDGGDGGDSAATAAGMAAANAAAANADAGWGGGQGVTAQGAAAGYGGVGMGSPAGAPAGTSTGYGGEAAADQGFGAPSAMGSSVSFGGSPAAAFGNSGFGSGPGVSTAAVGPGTAGSGNAAAAGTAAGFGGPASGFGGNSGGTAAGGSGFGNFGSGLGFGLGQSGRGNTAAANSNTALQALLAQTQMRYGFVNGNDPGLANSQTGQLALNQFSSPQALRAFAQTVSNPGYAQAIGYSPSQIAALNAQLAALEGGASGGSGSTPASQGFSNVGYGGGSPSQSVGGFGGNTTATGAEGVNTAALSPQQFSTPQAQQQYNQALAYADAEQKGYSPSQIQAINAVNRTGMPSPGQFSSPQAAQQFAAAAQQKASGPPQERNGKVRTGGRIEHRSNGGLASIPTDQLIDLALNKIRQRKNRAGGGSSNADNLAQIASYNPRGAAALSKMTTVSAIDGVNPNGTPNVIQVPNYFYGMSTDSNSSPTPSASPDATNTPAIPSGQVGNHANSATGSPIGGVPIATPTVGPVGSTDPSGPQYNNTLDQVLGTNSPTMDQIFGFTYPTIPPPKPQPVGPVPQSLINNLYGFSDGSQTGTGSQFFQSGGAVIMDALNRARRATKGKSNV